MILAQRKRHLYTWVVLGLLLPLGFGLSWQVIPQDKIEIPAKHMEFISVEYSHHGGTQYWKFRFGSHWLHLVCWFFWERRVTAIRNQLF